MSFTVWPPCNFQQCLQLSSLLYFVFSAIRSSVDVVATPPGKTMTSLASILILVTRFLLVLSAMQDVANRFTFSNVALNLCQSFEALRLSAIVKFILSGNFWAERQLATKQFRNRASFFCSTSLPLTSTRWFNQHI